MVPPDSTIDWCFGTPSLHPHTGQALCRSFDNYRPQTLREMESLMGKAADVEYKAPEGLYSLWGYRQTNTGGFFYSSKVCCVSVKGQIIAVAALYPTRSGQGVAAGDKYLFDGGTQPKAVGKVCDMFFRKQELDRASHFGKRVEFSADGKLSVLLGPGDKLLGWQGETPIVSRAQSMSQQENTPAPGLDISPVVNALVNPQTWQVPPPSANELELQQIADRNRAKTQMFIDEQRAKADYQREKYFELLEKRSKEIGKMKFPE